LAASRVSHCCSKCARRQWLLGVLSTRLDFCARDPVRFWRLLELSDVDLIDAIGGRRRAALHAAWGQWEPRDIDSREDMESICPHHPAYPSRLCESMLAPHALSVDGGLIRFADISEEAVVAIVGTRRASDYGMEIARELAHGLAASGVTVASGLSEGIAVAAHSGALEAAGMTFTVMAGGLDRCYPAWCRSLYRRVIANGCAISEAPRDLPSRSWSVMARARTLALLAELVIVVEAEERPWELACADIAQELGKPVAAVPGRLNSPASRGSNSLLMRGAQLIRGPQDALDLLYGIGARRVPEPMVKIEPQLQRVLERVGSGGDTLAKLTARGSESDSIAQALVELELRGLLLRGDGGRYVTRVGMPTK
jgi:DNA protecting protein DprA